PARSGEAASVPQLRQRRSARSQHRDGSRADAAPPRARAREAEAIGGAMTTAMIAEPSTWVDVCALDELECHRGACALVGEYQVALFRIPDGTRPDAVFALSNYDPFSQAYVLSRGIVGNRGDVLKVASPIFKQSFDLRTGRCLDDPSVGVMTFVVRV